MKSVPAMVSALGFVRNNIGQRLNLLPNQVFFGKIMTMMRMVVLHCKLAGWKFHNDITDDEEHDDED